MKLKLTLILFVTLVTASAPETVAQGSKENTDSVQAAEDLRAQLLDVQAKESELQARARQLDEDLKPENIERSLAGIGSTKPEELREMRSRQLTIERDRVQAQTQAGRNESGSFGVGDPLCRDAGLSTECRRNNHTIANAKVCGRFARSNENSSGVYSCSWNCSWNFSGDSQAQSCVNRLPDF